MSTLAQKKKKKIPVVANKLKIKKRQDRNQKCQIVTPIEVFCSTLV